MSGSKGIVFDILHYAINDGPGIRTLVFFKGCALRCRWCANPESQRFAPDILFFKNKCRGCGRCVVQCPGSAISNNEKFGFVSDTGKCSACGICTDSCYFGARSISGKEMTDEAVLAQVMKDIDFYNTSGGGVTFSGGEPFLQSDFLLACAGLCKKAGIDTAVETCGYAPWDNIKDVLPYLDLVFFDIKHIDAQKHLEYTGADNALILENLKKIDDIHTNIVVRIPYIPGINGDDSVMESIFAFAGSMKNIKYIEILPYHRMGLSKYNALGREYELKELLPVKREELKRYVDLGKACGKPVVIGG